MLPAPHANFFENGTIPRPRTGTGNARLNADHEKLGATMSCSPKRVFGPIAVFLGSRIGARWSHVLAELHDRLRSEADFRRVLPQLSELVEFHAVQEDGLLIHGSGLLKGQPLQAGWRRRLYVCPSTGRLRRIELTLANAG